MPVTARVIATCWDSPTAQGFGAGTVVEGFDPESESGQRLSSLKTVLGEWIFQYPGHEGKAPKVVTAAAPVQQVQQEVPKPKSKGRAMTPEQKAKMAAGREAAKASRLAAAAQ